MGRRNDALHYSKVFGGFGRGTSDSLRQENPVSMFRNVHQAGGLARLLVIFVVVAMTGVGCTPSVSRQGDYVSTIPPLKMLLDPLVKGRKEVVSLLPPGASPHTFTPSPADAIALETASAIFYVDSQLDGWVLSAGGKKAISVLDILPAPFQVAYPDSIGHEHDVVPHGEMNPHFWADPQAVAALVPGLLDKLIELDPEGRAHYEANGREFLELLAQLNDMMSEQMAGLSDVPIVAFHPSWSYFCARYGLNVVAHVEPIPGKELSPRTILTIREQLAGSERVLVLSEVQLPRKSADALAEALGATVEEIDPLGGSGPLVTYEGLITYNAQRLKAALE